MIPLSIFDVMIIIIIKICKSFLQNCKTGTLKIKKAHLGELFLHATIRNYVCIVRLRYQYHCYNSQLGCSAMQALMKWLHY